MNFPVTIDFSDFGNPLRKNDNFFINLLRERFPVEVTDDPDFLIYSHASNVHRLYTCKKIYWTSEVYAPNWDECDFALTHHYIEDPRHLRLPLYVLWVNPDELIKAPGDSESWLARKTKFCCFFSSYLNRQTEHRRQFFEVLSRYKRVDAGGKALNNIGGEVPFEAAAKMEFMKPYKFYMAFENQSIPGYTTEKIAEAMRARCIPIYWGNPEVVREFNPKSFINANDFPSLEALGQHVARVDQDQELCLSYVQAPFFHHNRPNEYFDKDRLLSFFDGIFRSTEAPLAARKRPLLRRWRVLKANPRHRMRVHEGAQAGPVAAKEMKAESKPA